MTDKEIETYILENQNKPKIISAEILSDIIGYKSRHIKAHIPAWVFDETHELLKSLGNTYGWLNIDLT